MSMIDLFQHRKSIRLWRLVFEPQQVSWYGPCNVYTVRRDGLIIKYTRPNW